MKKYMTIRKDLITESMLSSLGNCVPTVISRESNGEVIDTGYRILSCNSEFPNELASVHLVFHISLLKKFVGDPTTIVPLEGLGVKENISYEEVSI